MRKLKRSMAKANMQALGFERMFKKKISPVMLDGKITGYERKSPFGLNWRKYIIAQVPGKKRRRALAAK